MIAPAISVLSAVEGLGVVTPMLKPYVIPLTLLVITALSGCSRPALPGWAHSSARSRWWVLGARRARADQHLGISACWKRSTYWACSSSSPTARSFSGARIGGAGGGRRRSAAQTWGTSASARFAWHGCGSCFPRALRLLRRALCCTWAGGHPASVLPPGASGRFFAAVLLATIAAVVASQAAISALSIAPGHQLGYCPRR